MRLDRSFFEIQADFARRVAGILAIPEHEAFRTHTTFYWVAGDNDAGLPPERWSFDAGNPAWQAFVHAIGRGIDPVDYVHEHHLMSIGDEKEQVCFEYDFWPDFRWVRLHFGNSPDGLGLRSQSIPARQAELRKIFALVVREHPEATAVRGCSWLYHVPAYRRLFPPAFVDGLASAGYLHQFAALWGQFLDRHGRVKDDLGDRFIAHVEAAQSLLDLNRAFPLDVLSTTCPIDVFYRHFGIDQMTRLGHER